MNGYVKPIFENYFERNSKWGVGGGEVEVMSRTRVVEKQEDDGLEKLDDAVIEKFLARMTPAVEAYCWMNYGIRATVSAVEFALDDERAQASFLFALGHNFHFRLENKCYEDILDVSRSEITVPVHSE
jgi:hypothetical protein